MGVLAPGHGDGGRLAAAGEPGAHRGTGQVRPGGQPVPVHRLPQHRPRGARRGRGGCGGDAVVPASFSYKRAWSVDEALDLAAPHGDDATFLAGRASPLPPHTFPPAPPPLPPYITPL